MERSDDRVDETSPVTVLTLALSRGNHTRGLKGKGSPYSLAKRRVPELIPVLGSQPAGDVSHKPGGRLPLLSARPAVTLATLKRAAANFTDYRYFGWWRGTVVERRSLAGELSLSCA